MQTLRALALGLATVAWLSAAAAPSPMPAQESSAMRVNGTFDVKVTPQKPDNPEAEAAQLGRMSIAKQFHGALDATGRGEMLASGDGEQSGAYVALEKVTGTLQGRRGSFVLLHSAVMRRGVPEHWSVTVVPDSGSDELTGLSGTLKITIEGGGHHYDFQYALPES